MSSASGGTLFVAHGSPSLLEGGIPVHKFLTRLGQTLPRPRAILCISSHWETAEPCLTATRNPETLTDYEGTAGPAQIDFRCSGDSNLARRAAECLQVAGLKVTLNHTRGIDHAVWDPLRCMCPSGDVAVVEMSVQPAKPAAHHYEIGQALAPLTKEGYLVMGSGLAVHNLKHAAERADVAGGAPIWAQAFDEWLRSALLEGRYEDVVNYRTKAPFANLAHPTPEHLLPLIVALGAGGPAPRTHAINTGFGFASNSQACFYFQCQSDSLEADPVASALGVNALPLCQLLSASLSKRTVPVHRPKTKRKMLASSRPAPMLVSEAHLSALQKCVLEQAGGANPGAKKSPLEERLEHVLAAKQSPQLETLTRSVSLVKRTANQGLTGSAQPSTQQQQFLDSIRAQRPVSESLRSVVNPAVSSSGFQFGEGSRESLGAGEAFGGRSQTDQQFPDAQTEFQSGSPGLAWAITGGVSNPVNNPLRGVASNPGSPVTSAGGGANAQVPPITRTHSAPLQNVPRPGALQQTLEALFRESGNAGQSSDSSSGGQPVRMEQKHAAQSSLDGSFLGLDRIGYGLSPGSQGFGGSPGWRLSEPAHSGTERDRADQGGFAPRNEAASHQQEAASGGLHPGVLEGLNSQQRATSGGAFRGGGSPGFAESSFGEREGGGGARALESGGATLTWGGSPSGAFVGAALERSLTPPESTASAMLPDETQRGGAFDGFVRRERVDELATGGGHEQFARGVSFDELPKAEPMVETREGEDEDAHGKWTAEQEYAADAMLAGLSQPDWWLWGGSPRLEEPQNFERKDDGPDGHTGECYPVAAAQETAADAMLAGMSQPDWWSWVDSDIDGL